MTSPFTRNRNTWIAYVLLAFYAFFINIPGPITPFLRDELHLSYTLTSLHFSAFAVGILAVGFGGHLVIRRAGRWGALAIGALGLGAGALLLTLGRSAWVTVGAILLMGTVGSLILAVVPVTLSDEHGERRAVAISEANVLASLVASTAPLLVGGLAQTAFGWRAALILFAIPAALTGLGLLRLARRSGSSANPRPVGDSSPLDRVGYAQARRRLPFPFWYFWAALMLAVSVEFCMVYWSAAYMESVLGLPAASAAQTVSLFLAGMILGRLASSRVLQRFSERQVVLASLLLALLGFFVFWSASAAPIGMLGLALTGLGVAGLYPLILSLALGAAPGDESHAGTRLTLANGAAILLLPLALGRLADLAGLKPAFIVVGALLAGALGMMIFSHRLAPSARPAPSPAPSD